MTDARDDDGDPRPKREADDRAESAHGEARDEADDALQRKIDHIADLEARIEALERLKVRLASLGEENDEEVGEQEDEGPPADEADSTESHAEPKARTAPKRRPIQRSRTAGRPPRPPREPPPEDDEEDSGSIVREYRRVMYQFSFIGIEFGVAVALGFFFGRWLDSRWGTAPWMMLLWVAIGLTAAGRDLYRLVKRAQRKAKEGSSSNSP